MHEQEDTGKKKKKETKNAGVQQQSCGPEWPSLPKSLIWRSGLQLNTLSLLEAVTSETTVELMGHKSADDPPLALMLLRSVIFISILGNM